MLSDLRHLWRVLARSRAFAIVAVLTFAVGIGATTALFSALEALVLKPYSYPRADRLVYVWSGDYWPLSAADSLDLRSQATSFTAFGVYRPISCNVGSEPAQAMPGASCTSDVLRAFGVAPLLGRWLQPADEEPKAGPVVVISHAVWQQFFGADERALGRKLRINGVDSIVVGVTPRGFEFASPWMRTEDCQIWTPLSFDDKEKALRDNHYLLGVARLRDGISLGTADSEIKTIGKRLAALYPDSNTRKYFLVHSLHFEMTRNLGGQVWLLFGAVALVLLVACGNVASMLLARSVRRQAEFGVRVALGASRTQLMKLALLESGLLAVGGAALGLIFAVGGIQVLRVLAPVSAARKAAIGLDGWALGFALAATAVTAVLAGLPPALAARRTNVAAVMRTDSRGAVGSRERHRTLRNLVIAQIALAFLLAQGAVLFSVAYFKLTEENRVLATREVKSIDVSLEGPRYDQEATRVQFWYEFVRRVKGLPGIANAAMTSKLPLEGGNNTNGLVNDQVYDPTQERMNIERSSITEDYFPTMGLHLMQGRALRSEDRQGEIRGVVVNQALAAKAWPNKDPIGELIRGNNPGKPWFTVRVVGVVENVRQWGPTVEPQPEMYLTPEDHWGRDAHLVLRTSLPLSQVVPMVRRELSAIDPSLAIKHPRTMQDVVDTGTQSQRAVAELVNFFMVTALGLVAVGLYGTLSYHVQQRTPEIGVRMAIGALKNDILRLVLGQGLRWVSVGLLLGLGSSIALVSFMKSVVYHMNGLTASPLVWGIIAVGLTAALACWLPARRAAEIDAMAALRAE